MQSRKVCMLSIAWILVMFLRLSATNRRNQARRGLRRLRILVVQLMTGGPTRYCAINPNTSILRIWFDFPLVIFGWPFKRGYRSQWCWPYRGLPETRKEVSAPAAANREHLRSYFTVPR
ncbi:hypothetical protein DPEC_G00220720 [Dallia pectoralis]|uniref:Uncharacterized protein n=1 Tax=Dallia pectoralis TaxID=75939 RepID=A0ACC2G3Q2_DALPE|nr:hypothetical protein DPEC_G00220720 [Dallia pectoralis]